MWVLVVSLFVLLCLAGLLTARTGWGLDRSLPSATMALLAWLFLGYVCGVLHVFAWVTALAPLALGWLAVRSSLVRARLLRTLPALAMLLGALAAVLPFTQGSRVALWDELRLWGVYPKILHETSGALQLTGDSQLHPAMRGYTPGMPLFLYYLQAFGPFAERLLFAGHALFAMIFLMPLTRRASWRRPERLVVGTALLVVLPLYFSNSFNDYGDLFKSLFVEPIVGVVLAYGCYLVARGATATAAGRWQLGGTLLTLYLVKDGGLLLAVPFLVVSAVLVLRRPTGGPWRRRPLSLVPLAAPLALGYAVWAALLAIFPPRDAFSQDYLAAHGYGPVARTMLRHLVEFSVRGTRPIGLLGYRGFVYFALAALAIAVAAAWLLPRARRTLALTGIGTALVVCLFNLLGIYLITVTVFRGTFASFARYVGVPLTCLLVLAALLALDHAVPWRALSTRRGALVARAACALGLVFLAVQFPARPPQANSDAWFRPARANAATLTGAVRAAGAAGTADHPTRVFSVYGTPYAVRVGLAHRTYFNQVGSGVLSDNFLDDTVVPNSPAGIGRLTQLVRERGDQFVFVAEEGPGLAALRPVFPDVPRHGNLYRVRWDGDALKLERVA